MQSHECVFYSVYHYMSFPKMSIHYNPLNVVADRPIFFWHWPTYELCKNLSIGRHRLGYELYKNLSVG
jgi:hypothetical protein